MPKSDEFFEPYAVAAFNAYSVEAGGLTYDKKPIPPWEQIGAPVQANWLAAVKAVFLLLDVRDVETQQSFLSDEGT